MNSWDREIVLSDDESTRRLRHKTRRDFLIGGVAALGAIGGYEWMRSRKRDAGLAWPERRVLNFNEKLAHGYLGNSHLMPTYSRSEVGSLKPNGDIGLDDEHGAPLRLAIPVKYGIKNIKRVGLIEYTNERPADYWAEDGYDWFAGL